MKITIATLTLLVVSAFGQGTPAPNTPSPVTPVPTPAQPTPASPVTPAPNTPSPVTPGPTPAQPTPASSTPAPNIPSPVTPAPLDASGGSTPCPDVPDGGCSICGEGLCVTAPDKVFEFPGQPPVPCGRLEGAGFAGIVPLDTCPFLPNFTSDICACKSSIPGGAPTKAPVPIPAQPTTPAPVPAQPTPASPVTPAPNNTPSPVLTPVLPTPVQQPTPAPVLEPAPVPTPLLPPISDFVDNNGDCKNSPPNWHDGDGPEFDCNWYAMDNHCAEYGDIFEFNGLTANQVCCVCGGGQPTDGGATSGITCSDVPRWYDSDGREFDCFWYSDNDNSCEEFGNDFENFGYVAREACCTCGGGVVEE